MTWTIYVCPKCHTQGKAQNPCPAGCRRRSGEAAIGEPVLTCIAVEVDATSTGTIALINAGAKIGGRR